MSNPNLQPDRNAQPRGDAEFENTIRPGSIEEFSGQPTIGKAAAITVLVLLAGIMASMIYGGWPAFREFGLGFLTGTQWDTMNDRYGGLPAIIGTLSTALIALMPRISRFGRLASSPPIPSGSTGSCRSRGSGRRTCAPQPRLPASLPACWTMSPPTKAC